MKILITGATGFIGQALVSRLAADNQLVILSRSVTKAKQMFASVPELEAIDTLSALTDLNDIDAVINLAGEPIVGKRWSHTQKQRLCHSRWDITQALTDLIKASDTPPRVFISASAVGIYGVHHSEVLDEDGKVNPDFAHKICAHWESLAMQAQSELTRVCIPRIGIVLGAQGGALAKMLPAFKLGLGGPIGRGDQGMSWIHLDDLLALLNFMLTDPNAQGAYNAVAPTPVSNKDFTKALGRALHRPAFLPAPEFALKLALGESAMLLTEGQYVVPAKAQAEGFNFQYPRLDDALAQILGR